MFYKKILEKLLWSRLYFPFDPLSQKEKEK
jgi:hypothetical protein